LDAEGKRCWKRTVAALAAMELLTKTDRDAIAGLCQNWALFVKTSKLLNRMKRDESLMDARRLAAMNAEAYRNYARASAEFGLTCSSRSRLEVPDPAAGGRADKFDAFVGSKSG
jgi:P27 family predicted phage terminase small subunit